MQNALRQRKRRQNSWTTNRTPHRSKKTRWTSRSIKMAIVQYRELVRSISGNFGGNNAYQLRGKNILRARRGPQSGQTPAQRLQRNKARYFNIAITTGLPTLQEQYKIIQKGKPEGKRAQRNYKETAWYGNWFEVFNRGYNKQPASTLTYGTWPHRLGTVTYHDEPVLNDYITWTGRDPSGQTTLRLIYCQWNEQGKWDSTNTAILNFGTGSYTMSLLPNLVILTTTEGNGFPNENFGDCFMIGANINPAIEPSL